MLALGTIGLSYAPNAPCHHPPTARRSALLRAAEPSRWQVDAEAAFVAPAAPVPRQELRTKTQKASSLEAYMKTLSLDGIAEALQRQLGLDAVVDCVGDRPDLRSALRDCEVTGSATATTSTHHTRHHLTSSSSRCSGAPTSRGRRTTA